MIGHVRLDNIEKLAWIIAEDDVPGDFLEAGVWRGGACILMRALIGFSRGLMNRKVWVCDSFAGLPQPDSKYPIDDGDEHYKQNFLAVSLEEVRGNFARYGLLDERVCFLPGWFKDTLPGPVGALSLLRLDGDMYGSTIEVLEALYDRVSPGGFIIVDDYGALKGARAAVDDFRAAREIESPIVQVDWTGVYWRKTF